MFTKASNNKLKICFTFLFFDRILILGFSVSSHCSVLWSLHLVLQFWSISIRRINRQNNVTLFLILDSITPSEILPHQNLFSTIFAFTRFLYIGEVKINCQYRLLETSLFDQEKLNQSSCLIYHLKIIPVSLIEKRGPKIKKSR